MSEWQQQAEYEQRQRALAASKLAEQRLSEQALREREAQFTTTTPPPTPPTPELVDYGFSVPKTVPKPPEIPLVDYGSSVPKITSPIYQEGKITEGLGTGSVKPEYVRNVIISNIGSQKIYLKNIDTNINILESNIRVYKEIESNNTWDSYDWSKYDGGLTQYKKEMSNQIDTLNVARQNQEKATNNLLILNAKLKFNESGNINPREYIINKEDTGTYVVRFGDDPTQFRTFNNKTAANDFAKQLAKDQNTKIKNLEKDGIITKTDKGYEIISDTTDMERARLIDAGFIIDVGIKSGWSRQIYEWGQQFGDHNWKDKPTNERNLGDYLHGSSEYYAAVLGTGGLNSLENSIDWINSFMGNKSSPKSQLTVENLRRYEGGLDPARQAMVYMGGAGASYLANTLAYIPVGVAVTGIFTGATKIAAGLKITSPEAVKKIAQTIASQPLLAKAILYSTITSLEAAQIYKEYKSGKDMGDVLGREAVRAGALMGSFHGMDIGFRLPTKVKGWIDTRGRTNIPLDELMSPEYIKGDKNIGLYQSGSKQQYSEEFKAYARRMSASKYMGEVAPNEMRLWHGTENYDQWIKRVGLTTDVAAGTSTSKFSGLFVAPELSPLRLPRGAGGSIEGGKLGIPTFGGTSYGAYGIDAIVDVMPSGMSRAETQAWLALQAGKRTAYIPPVSMITQEMEAIIPEGSKLRLVSTDWYINWQGVRVPVNKYVLIGVEEVANATATGVKLVDYAVVAESTLPTKQVYLSFGLISPSGNSISNLSPREISVMASEYGVTVTEMKSIISDTTKMLELNNTSIPDTKYTSLSDSLSKTDLIKLTEMDYSKFARDIVEMSTTEQKTIFETTPTTTITETINEMTYKQMYEILPTLYESYTKKEITEIIKKLDYKHKLLFNKVSIEMKSTEKVPKQFGRFKVEFFYKESDTKRITIAKTFDQALRKVWFDRGSPTIPKRVKVTKI